MNRLEDSGAPREESTAARAAGDQKVIEGQARALELAVRGAPLADILEILVRTVEAQSTSCVLASILLLEPGTQRLRHGAAPSLPAEYNAAIDGLAIGPRVGSCGTAAFTGQTVVVTDIEVDPLWTDFIDLARRHGLRSSWSKPILSPQGNVLGTFALYHPVPANPSSRDREIVDLLAPTAALVMERERQASRLTDAEAELRALREREFVRLGAIFEHAPAGIAVLRGPEHVFEVANSRYCELIGRRAVVGKPLREAVPEIENQVFGALLDEVRRTGEPYIGRAARALLKRGGSEELDEAFFDFVYQPVPDDSGAANRIIVVAFEVTDLVKARIEADAARALAERSENGLRSFIDHLPELAWTARPDGHIDYYNRRWYEYTGTTFEDMQGWGWEKVHDPELLPKVVARWKHSLQSGEPFEMEFTLRGADGIPRWFLTRVAASRDASGNIIRWFGTNTNIDQIKAAQALALAMSEQSRDVQRLLLEMRDDKEKALKRVAELEVELHARDR